jgi:cytidylate kinase
MHSYSRSVSHLVDEAIRRWELEQRARRPLQQPRPVITVSREYGARGAELARLLAQRLGFACWDQELLHEVARTSQAPERLLLALDEHRRNVVSELTSLVAPRPTASEYFHALVQVVHTVAAQGSAVIVGRGAQFALDRDAALRVRVVCPVALRVQHLMASRGRSRAQAEEELGRVDDERRDFVLENYHRDPVEPSAYDLVVNTGTFTLPAAAALVESAYALRFAAPAAAT